MSSSESEETSSQTVSTEVAYKEVQEWLKTIYGNRSIPHFEVNAKTISILNKLRMVNLSSNRDAHMLKEHQDKLSAFYASEGNKICESLRFTGVEMRNLSQPCQLAVKSLSEVACRLNLKSPSTSDFLLGLNNLSRQQMTAVMENSKSIHMKSQLSKKLNSAVQTNQRLHRELTNKEESSKKQDFQQQKRTQQTEFLQGKQKEYSHTIRKLQSELSASGVTPDICHKALVKKSEEVRKLQAKLNEARAKVKSFQNLPPNENLARLKIEKAKEELLRLEGELQMKISPE